MKTESLVYLCTSDISGKLRGKGFPAAMIDGGASRAVGWTPTNVQITCFDTIADSPYGALGDLVLVPDPATRARVDFGDDGPVEDFMLGDVLHLDGRPWECCTRAILRQALERLEAAAGLGLFGAFEHEFHLPRRGGPKGESYTLSGFRSERHFGEVLVAALAAAGIAPDTFLREYGPDQFEVTIQPVRAIAIADQAAVLREVTRATGERLGRPVSFSPLRRPGAVGNGVHIHLSFRDPEDRPATYDPDGPHGMAAVTGAFIAGVLRHLPAIIAFTAPSVISYQRLVPHRWSAAFNNLGQQDRESAVRLCPVTTFGEADPAAQFNFEIRAADAAASPHLALAAIVHAGVSGIEAGLAPPEATEEDISEWDVSALSARGFERLPRSLDAALERLQGDADVRGWFPPGFVDIYLAHKRDEIAYLADMTEEQACAAYEEVY
ncbi:MAG: glutamine synthetase family protein [Limibaculum sp.]